MLNEDSSQIFFYKTGSKNLPTPQIFTQVFNNNFMCLIKHEYNLVFTFKFFINALSTSFLQNTAH